MNETGFCTKLLLVTEFILAFGVPAVILAYGILMLPFVALWSPLQPLSAAYVIVVTIFGAFGLWSASRLLVKALKPNKKVMSPIKLKVGIFCGLLSGIALIEYFSEGPIWLRIVATLPIIVGLHLVWLNKHYLNG